MSFRPHVDGTVNTQYNIKGSYGESHAEIQQDAVNTESRPQVISQTYLLILNIYCSLKIR